MATLAAAAVAYARRGLKVLPLLPRGKEPNGSLTPHGLKQASSDPDQVAAWWAQSPDANIGLATGEGSRILVLDVDAKDYDGFVTLAALEHEFGLLPVAPFQTTGEKNGRRGKQIFFQWTEEIRNAQGLKANGDPGPLGYGLDVRGDGGYVVAAPSVHPSGVAYAWDSQLRLSKITPPPMPEWMLARLRKRSKAAPAPIAAPAWSEIPEAYGRAALEAEFAAVAGCPTGNRNNALNTAAFNMGTLAAVNGVRWQDTQAALMAAASANGYLAEEGPAHVESVIRGGFEAGLQHPREIKPSNKPPRGAKPRLAASGGRTVTAANPKADAEADVFTRNAKGELKANALRNIIGLLEQHEETAGIFAWDDHAAQIVVTRRPPWARNNGFTPNSALSDADEAGVVLFLESLGQSASINIVHAAIIYLASENHIHAVRSAFAAMQWDGKERLDHWLCDYLEAPETSFVRAVGAKWMIGAVARVMRPGSKVDTMLILEGPQGLKKSTALAALSTIGGVEYFADRLSALGGKETAMELQGKLIIEIAELDALRRAEVSQIKAFLSQRFDRYRMPWGRNAIDRPRQCVFAGTVNPGAIGYLNDPTGGRRFWPVPVHAVDLRSLVDAREQLWAEAVHRYNSGERWWLEDAEADEAREQQQERYDVDVWGDKIDSFCAGKSKVQIPDILTEGLSVPLDRMNDMMKKRVAAHLRFRNWERRRWRDPSRGGRPTWYFFNPETAE